MITVTTRKWGNSLGIVLPKEEVDQLKLHENEKVTIEITKVENPLKELFGFSKNNPITQKQLKESKKLFESKWLG